MPNLEEAIAYCPLCGKQVKRVTEIEQEEKRKTALCWNEFYIHTRDGLLIKILNPKTLWS